MFERLTTPEEAFNFKLGAALTMERTVLEILDANIEEAQDQEVVALFREHRAESQGHVQTLEEAFAQLGWEVDDSPCPAIDGLKAEGKATAKMTDASLVDSVLLQGAVEVEHHEIAVYENLILNAHAMGRDDVVELLRRNLESEQSARDKAIGLQTQGAAVTPKNPPRDGGGMGRKIKDALTT
jgi:ferritin-like metal-binding protein YciE